MNINNPVLLFLHGGPGAAATALLRRFNGDLEKNFTVVYWDQRNAGKSYSRNFPKREIRVRKYLQDIDTLVSYLKNRFKVDKIFLIGHSWGSRLGMLAIQRHPENFMAYVGIGQEVASYEEELVSYRYTLQRAKEEKNKKALKELEKIGEPRSGNYAEMYKSGLRGGKRQKHWLLKLGGERYNRSNYNDWILPVWLSREYTFFDLVRYLKASEFSAGNIVKDPDFNNLNLFKQIPEVEVPVFFISGKFDYNCPWPVVKEYFEHLKAPHKEFILFDKSAHSPVFEEPDKFNKEILRIYESLNNTEVTHKAVP